MVFHAGTDLVPFVWWTADCCEQFLWRDTGQLLPSLKNRLDWEVPVRREDC
jgi:hypothetical protein